MYSSFQDPQSTYANHLFKREKGGESFFDEGDLEQKQYTFTTMYKKLIISATSIPFIKSVEHKTFICWLFPFFVCVNETWHENAVQIINEVLSTIRL